MTMREGLVHSRNMVAIQLGMRVGMDSSRAAQRSASTKIDPVRPSDRRVVRHPIDMVTAYTVSPTMAQSCPRFITRINATPRIARCTAPRRQRNRCLDPAWRSSCALMRDVAERKRQAAAEGGSDNAPVAGKTARRTTT
jgi:membrane peptidoglycan carboxypeptidase